MNIDGQKSKRKPIVFIVALCLIFACSLSIFLFQQQMMRAFYPGAEITGMPTIWANYAYDGNIIFALNKKADWIAATDSYRDFENHFNNEGWVWNGYSEQPYSFERGSGYSYGPFMIRWFFSATAGYYPSCKQRLCGYDKTIIIINIGTEREG